MRGDHGDCVEQEAKRLVLACARVQHDDDRGDYGDCVEQEAERLVLAAQRGSDVG